MRWKNLPCVLQTISLPVRPGAHPAVQAHLFADRKLDAISVAQQVSALRFLFLKTLKRAWRADEMPAPKQPIRLPQVLSREEVEQLIRSAANPLHRIWLLILYGTGMRR